MVSRIGAYGYRHAFRMRSKGGLLKKVFFILVLGLMVAIPFAQAIAATTPAPSSPASASPTPTPDEDMPTCKADEYVSRYDGKAFCAKLPVNCTKNFIGATVCQPCGPNESMNYVDGKYKCIRVPKCSEGQFLYSDGTKFECKTP